MKKQEPKNKNNLTAVGRFPNARAASIARNSQTNLKHLLFSPFFLGHKRNKYQYQMYLASAFLYGYQYADPHVTHTAPHPNTAPTPANLTAPLHSYNPRPNVSAASPYKPPFPKPETNTHTQTKHK